MNTPGINIFMKKLRNGDYNVRPFIANKTWYYSSDDVIRPSDATQEEVDVVWGNAPSSFIAMMYAWIQQLGTTEITIQPTSRFTNVDGKEIGVFRFYYPENYKYFGNILNVSSSLYSNEFEHQTIDPKLIWYYMDHNFYKDYDKNRHSATITDYDSNSYLSETGSVLLLPRTFYGEGIQKGTFKLSNFNNESSLRFDIVDDGLGNIIDTTFDKTKFAGKEHNLLYVGFNEKYREYNVLNKKLNYVLDYSNNLNKLQIVNPKKISYHPGILTTEGIDTSGVCAHFSESYLNVENYELFNFPNEFNFAFSFWINIPPTQSVQNFKSNPLFDKKTVKMADISNNGVKTFSIDSNIVSSQYPFDIELNNLNSNNPNTISFKQSSGVQTVELISPEISSSVWNHVVCQKNNNDYEIWLNGERVAYETKIINDNIQNDNNFYIGGNGTNNNFYYGKLDEIRIYSKPLNEDQIQGLGDNSFENGYAYQTDQIGNIFYDVGIISISDPRPKYKNLLLGKNGRFDYESLEYGFESSFKTTTTLYEHEVVCKIPRGEFNNTQNQTSMVKYNKKYNVKPFVTGSSFSPYITSIGLYNNNNDLVAIAKLATPLKKRKDIDINVIIRFDM
jgi:hypothetical protein